MSALDNPPVQPTDDELPIDLGAMWEAVWSHKIVLALGLLLGAVGSVIFAFMQPVYYTAQVKVMPPTSQSGGGSAAMLAALGGLGGLGGGAASALGIKNPGDLYVGLLKSRSISDAMIEQFNLKEVYKEKTLQETRTELQALTKAASGKEGIITIDVDDQDPKRAASMANAYFKALQDMMQRMATTEAGQRRLFFENQLKQAKNNLTDAEEGFKGMQQKTGVLQLDAQGKVAIESVARIRAAIAAKEVELAAIRQFATPENPQYQRPATELTALRGEIGRAHV